MPDKEPLETHGLSLEQILFRTPDEPLPSIAGFDRIESREQAVQLNDWIQSQRTCTIILKHHGDAGLRAVLKGIASACSKFKVPMTSRVKSAATAYGMKVY